jgi:competence protein ComEC
MNLIALAIAWMVGVVVADLVGIQASWTLPLTGIGIVLAFVGLLLHWRWRPNTQPMVGINPRAIVVHLPLCLAIALFAAARLCAVQIPETPQGIWKLADHGEITVSGWITTDPKRTEGGQQLIVQAESAQVGKHTQVAEGLVIVTIPSYPERRYGDRIVLTGKLLIPRGPDRPGSFDYRAYLRRKGILVMLRDPLLRVAPGVVGIAPLRALLAFRDHCKDILIRQLPEPQASIAIGVLLGLQSSIPDDVYATFSVTGTSHILVVSGWNFTIVATMLAGLTTRLRFGKGITLGISLAVLWTYALFVGATGTVLRAAVMSSLAVIARATNRQGEAWTLLMAACWGLSVYDPYVLWDLGFQLSALATASLFAYGKPVEGLLARIPILNHEWLAWANEALTATLAAQILALPIILYNFGNLSIIAPLANILLVPVVPYIMLLVTLALVCGLIWQPFGQIAALASWGPLTWLTEGARLLAQAPGASAQLPPFPLWMLLLYYAIVVGGWWWVVSAKLVQGEAIVQ